MPDPAFADAVLDWLHPPGSSREVVAGAATFTPANPEACRLSVEYAPEDELITLCLGPERIPVELSLSGPIVPADARPWVTERAEAVFAGRYEQERTTLRDGALVGIVGTFHLVEGDVRHVYRRRLGWFRRKRRSRVTFATYE